MDYAKFNFLSLGSLDKVAWVYPSDGSAATFYASANAYNSTITIAHDSDAPFVPIIKYSFDGGSTWYYNGDTSLYWHVYDAYYSTYATNPSVVAKANDSQVVLTYNNGPIGKTVYYKIYGIARNV